MATVVNVKPNDPFAGFGDAFSRALENRRQRDADAETRRLAHTQALELMQKKVNAENAEQAEIGGLVDIIGSPAPTITDGLTQEQINKANFDALIQGIPVEDVKSGQEQLVESFTSTHTEQVEQAKKKLGEKNLLVHETYPHLAVTMTQSLAIDKAKQFGDTNAVKYRLAIQEEDKNKADLKTADEQAAYRTNIIATVGQYISKNKLYQGYIKAAKAKDPNIDNLTAAKELATWMVDNDGTMANFIIAGGDDMWIKKSAVGKANLEPTDIVRAGTSNALPMNKFAQSRHKTQDIPSNVLTDDIKFSRYLTSRGIKKDVVPGTMIYERLNQWWTAIEDPKALEYQINSNFMPPMIADMKGWNTAAGGDRTMFKSTLKKQLIRFHDGIIQAVKKEDGLKAESIPAISTFGAELADSMLNEFVSIYKESGQDKKKRAEAFGDYLSDSNMTKVVTNTINKLPDGQRVAAHTIIGIEEDPGLIQDADGNWIESGETIKGPVYERWQTAVKKAAENGLIIGALQKAISQNDPSILNSIRDKFINMYPPEDKEQIENVFRHPNILAGMISQQLPQGQ